MTDQQCIENAMNAHANYLALAHDCSRIGSFERCEHYQRVADAFLAAADEIERGEKR